MDSLPRPAWDLVDVEQYRNAWLDRHGYYSMNMVTTRGCPYHCNWCAKPIWGQRYNSRSPEAVAAELKWLKETYHPDHIWFVDDIMGLKPGWMRRFADEIERLDAHVPFKCLSRVDLLLRDGDIDALRRAGCQIVWVGAESGSQKILDAMEKGTKVEQIYEASRRLHAAGVKVAFFLQFGYPGETREDIELTLQMVRDCQPDDIGMSVSYPLPGTKFYDRVHDELGAKQNWQDSSRPGDALRRAVRHRVLPPPAHGAAQGIPGAQDLERPDRPERRPAARPAAGRRDGLPHRDAAAGAPQAAPARRPAAPGHRRAGPRHEPASRRHADAAGVGGRERKENREQRKAMKRTKEQCDAMSHECRFTSKIE